MAHTKAGIWLASDIGRQTVDEIRSVLLPKFNRKPIPQWAERPTGRQPHPTAARGGSSTAEAAQAAAAAERTAPNSMAAGEETLHHLDKLHMLLQRAVRQLGVAPLTDHATAVAQHAGIRMPLSDAQLMSQLMDKVLSDPSVATRFLSGLRAIGYEPQYDEVAGPVLEAAWRLEWPNDGGE